MSKRQRMGYRSWISIFLILLGGYNASDASILSLSQQEMREIVRVARAIHTLQPRLEENKFVEYAIGIFRAAEKYNIDPMVIVAITHQETSFRENLPEGRAGEIGICQIRKIWLKNPKFREEFRNTTIKDLHKPSRSFLIAAWILRDLKNSAFSSTLPYWSFYNAVRFENRFKYFVSVNQKIANLRKQETFWVDRYAASEARTEDRKNPEPVLERVAIRRPVSKPFKVTPNERWKPAARAQRIQAVLKMLPPVESKLIPLLTPALASSESAPLLSPQLIRAAAEIGIANRWLKNAPVEE